jgi:hypothetical protein
MLNERSAMVGIVCGSIAGFVIAIVLFMVLWQHFKALRAKNRPQEFEMSESPRIAQISNREDLYRENPYQRLDATDLKGLKSAYMAHPNSSKSYAKSSFYD